MAGLTATPRASALMATSLVARLPLAMFSISLLVHVPRLTGSFAIAGAAGGAYVIGRGLTSPLLGRLVDRHGQTLVLVGCAAASATLLVAVALLPANTPDPLVIVLCGAIGTVSPPLAACVRALLPVIVTDPDALSAAYTLETTALELTFIAGPPLALGLATGLSTRAPLLAGAIILLAATAGFAAQPASRHWRGRSEPSEGSLGALRSPAIRGVALILIAVGIVFGAVDVAVAATASAMHAIGDTGPLLGGLLVLAGAAISPATGSIYALAGRTAPSGTKTETFAWLLSANATGASIGVAVAGALSQTAGPQAAFALAAGAGALAVLIALATRLSLDSESQRDRDTVAHLRGGLPARPEVIADR